jgi:hypothetical protein
MVTNDESRRHHFLPRSFLKHWIGKDGKLTRTYFNQDQNLIMSYRAPTKSVANEKNLYNITEYFRTTNEIKLFIDFLKIKYNIDEEIHPNLEHSIFMAIDHKGLKAHAAFLDGCCEYSSLIDFIIFIYMLQARNPMHMKQMNSAIQNPELVKQLNEFGLSEILLSEDRNLAKLAIIDCALDIKSIKNLYDGISIKTLTLKTNLHSFITSNNPYVAIPNIGLSNAFHIIPISPKKCLFMYHDLIGFGHLIDRLTMASDEHLSYFINIIMAIYSNELFSTSIPDRRISCLLNLHSINPEEAKRRFSDEMRPIIG